MTRYKRRATRDATMRELIAEVRALRAEVAVLSAERIQIVPYPYPQPYPVYPVIAQQTIPWERHYTPYITIGSGSTFTPVSTPHLVLYDTGGND